jgi:hypothetical protein
MVCNHRKLLDILWLNRMIDHRIFRIEERRKTYEGV